MDEIKTKIIGIVFLFIGCIVLWLAYKYPLRKEYDFTQANVKGYMGGIGFIILGILTLTGWFKW
jgi:hypothetical protein